MKSAPTDTKYWCNYGTEELVKEKKKLYQKQLNT